MDVTAEDLLSFVQWREQEQGDLLGPDWKVRWLLHSASVMLAGWPRLEDQLIVEWDESGEPRERWMRCWQRVVCQPSQTELVSVLLLAVRLKAVGQTTDKEQVWRLFGDDLVIDD